jgi:ATPase family AAA domain-containing protein 3A/B
VEKNCEIVDKNKKSFSKMRMISLFIFLLSTNFCYGTESELPSSVMHGLSYLYTDISRVNTTEALHKLMLMDLFKYEFIHDSVEGRKQVGVLPKDALRIFPDSVDIVESYALPSKNKQPPITLSNFPVVDKNGIFMHGLAALQELQQRYDALRNELSQIQDHMQVRNLLFDDIKKRIDQAASEKEIQRKELAEASLENEKQRSLMDRDRIKDDEMLLKAALDEEKAVLSKQEELLSERMKISKEREKANYEEAIRLERQYSQQALESQEKHNDKLVEKRAALDTALAEKRIELEKEKIRAETDARIARDEANESMDIRKLQAAAKLESQKWQNAITTVALQTENIMKALISNPSQLAMAVGAVLFIFFMYFLFREMIVIMREFAQSQLGKPALVRETSYKYLQNPLPSWLLAPFISKETLETSTATVMEYFSKVILSPDVNKRISEIAIATRNTKSNNAPFRHLLLHGPPGTGKTLIAKTLAECSGMDYAIMSGGDVGPLGDDAVSQLHRLFHWASTSSKGLMLFIDEAEAFLNARASAGGDDSIHRRHALNALLYQTGTQSKQFMLVLATNRPEDLDAAVLDRMDASVLIDLPPQPERERLTALYMKEHVQKFAKNGNGNGGFASKFLGGNIANCEIETTCTTKEIYNKIAERISGFSGREVSKLFIAVHHSMLLSADRKLTMSILNDVLDSKITEHRQKEGFNASLSVSSSPKSFNSPLISTPAKKKREEAYDNSVNMMGETSSALTPQQRKEKEKERRKQLLTSPVN